MPLERCEYIRVSSFAQTTFEVRSMGCDCDSLVGYFDNLIRRGDKRGLVLCVTEFPNNRNNNPKWLFSIDESFL